VKATVAVNFEKAVIRSAEINCSTSLDAAVSAQ
jgi:hypothetical protein